MPALVNIKVGSLRGTSGDDGTISWPFSAKKSRNFDLISLTPLMFIQSEKWPGSGSQNGLFRRMIRQSVMRVWREDHAQINGLERGRTQNRVPLLLAALLENAFRQGSSRCPETVQADHRVAAAHKSG